METKAFQWACAVVEKNQKMSGDRTPINSRTVMPTIIGQEKEEEQEKSILPNFIYYSIILICTIAGCSQKNESRTDSLSKVTIDKKYLSVGDIWEQDPFQWEVVIANNSDEQIESTLQSNCTCTQIDPPKIGLAPHESKSIKLRLDLAKVLLGEKFKESVIQTSLLMNDTKTNAQKTWNINGKVKRCIEFSEDRIELADIDSKKGIDEQIEVYASKPVEKFEAQSELLDDMMKFERLSDNSATLKIKGSPKIKQGMFENDVIIRVFNRGNMLSSRSIHIRGNITGKLIAKNDYIIFGVKEVGDIGEETFTVESQNGMSYEIISIQTDDKDMQITQTSATPYDGSRRQFLVVQHFSRIGFSKSYIDVKIRLASGEILNERVTVEYQGVSPNSEGSNKQG